MAEYHVYLLCFNMNERLSSVDKAMIGVAKEIYGEAMAAHCLLVRDRVHALVRCAANRCVALRCVVLCSYYM